MVTGGVIILVIHTVGEILYLVTLQVKLSAKEGVQMFQVKVAKGQQARNLLF